MGVIMIRFFLKISFCLSIISFSYESVKCNQVNTKFIISFNKLFPETQLEEAYKICCQLFDHIDTIKLNNINELEDDELTPVLDSLINLYNILLISKTDNKNIIKDDLIYLINFLDKLNIFLDNKIGNLDSPKINCVFFLFNEIGKKINYSKLLNMLPGIIDT